MIRLKADIMTKSLQDYTKEELIEQIKSLKKSKKFGLVWEDKPEQVAIDCETKLPVLSEVTERAITKADDQPTNLIIEGDNYHSLSTLNYTHAGSVDVIYIDPPYNTGGKDFIYNDKYVDTEDGFRHSKWLSFMSKRLKLSKDLLTKTGVIFISIDDHEQANLKVLCDDIFGEDNFIAQFIVVRSEGGGLAKQAVIGHDYLLAYARDIKQFTPLGKPKDIRGKIVDIEGEKYWIETDWLRKEFGKYGTCLYEEIEKYKGKDKKIEVDEGIKAGKYILLEKGTKHIVGRYRKISDDTSKFYTILKHLNKNGVHDLRKLDVDFDFPKPTSLLKEIIMGATIRSKTGIILDFFAGSGTTAQAVMELNTEDGGNRRFIVCTNNENGIAENVTYSRIKKLAEGYGDHRGLPTNLRYFKTSFVDKAENTDQTRVALVARATDMIKVRENTFDTVIEEDLFKAYEGSDTYSVIVFDPSVIDKAKAEIAKLSDDKTVRVYVFSLANDSYVSDFADLDRQVELCPIPESILEVYKRIFDQKGTK